MAVHVYNASDNKITVQCHKPESSDRWGGMYHIEPKTAALVYDAGLFDGDTDLVVTQYVNLTKANGEQVEAKIKQKRFYSHYDRSWIATDFNIKEQDHGNELHIEAPGGELHPWDIAAKDYNLKEVVYGDLPKHPDKWELNDTASGIVENKNSEKVTKTTTLTLSCTETKNWTNKLGIKTNVTTHVKAGIPLLAEGKIQLGAEGLFEHVWGEAHSESKTWQQSVSVPVPSNRKAEVTARAMHAIVTLPYTATFVINYESGEEPVVTQVKGEYRGVCATKTEISVAPEQVINPSLETQTQAVEVTPVSALDSASVDATKKNIDALVTLSPGGKVQLIYNDKDKKVTQA